MREGIKKKVKKIFEQSSCREKNENERNKGEGRGGRREKERERERMTIYMGASYYKEVTNTYFVFQDFQLPPPPDVSDNIGD